MLREFQKSFERKLFNAQINLEQEKNILFFGDPRGGTTWMAETLVQLFELPILWEPMLPRKNSRFAKFSFASRQYLPDNLKNKEIHKAFSDLLHGKGVDHWEINHTSVKELKKSKCAIIKFTRGNMLLPYITKQFSFEKKPIYMLRNPMAVVASQLKHVGWKDAKNHFEIPDTFYNEVYDTHREFLKTLKTKEEVLVAKWALTNKIVLEHPRHDLDWIFITYEETLLKPKETLTKVLDNWGYTNFNLDKIDFNKKSKTSLSSKRRPPEEQLAHWKSSFTDEQIQKMKSVLTYFSMDNHIENY